MRRIFRRPQLAFDLATQLLSPGVLDQGLRSGLGRPPDTATVEDLRNFQLHLVDLGTSAVAAL